MINIRYMAVDEMDEIRNIMLSRMDRERAATIWFGDLPADAFDHLMDVETEKVTRRPDLRLV